jgi:hypothetical protein
MGDFYHLNLRYTAVISAVGALRTLKTIQPGCSRKLRSNTILATKRRLKKTRRISSTHAAKGGERGGIKLSSHSVLVHHETLGRLRGGAFARFATPMA